MKIISILTLLIGFSMTSVFAQEGTDHQSSKKEKKEMSPEERADKMTDKMNEILGLDTEQKEKVRAINLAHAKEMEKIHEEMKALKKKIKEEREKTKSEIDQVLNDEQREKLELERQKRKEEHQNKRKEKCSQEKE